MKYLAVTVFMVFAISGAHCWFPWFESARNFEKLPNHKNYTAMSRFIVHRTDWATVTYKSFDKDTSDAPMGLVASFADGPLPNGTGIPYLFLTEYEPGVKDILKAKGKAGLVMSLAQTDICAKNKWDTEDPRCARVFMNGRIEKLDNKTAEYQFAKKAFTARHPLFANVPPSHGFFYAKYVIQTIKLISGFGGVRTIPLKEYYACKDSK